MTHVILLDPGLVIPQTTAPQELSAFWDRLLQWCDDRRAVLGSKLWGSVAALYAAGEIPSPPGLGQITHRTVGDLLSRQPPEHQADDEQCGIEPEYSGAQSHRQLLITDLLGTAGLDGRALGSHEQFWPADAALLEVIVGATVALVNLTPNSPSPEDRLREYAAWFDGKSIVIVGGQVDHHVLAALGQELAINLKRVQWIPSEYNKKATNLKAVIGGLDVEDIVICVAGKVGHDVSGQMESACKTQKVTLHKVRSSSNILQYLDELSSV
jgi:hypothetical protein